MEGLGEGYEAFLERLQSDFAISKGSAQNGNPATNPGMNHSHGHASNANLKGGAKVNRGTFPGHLPPSHLPPPKYVGYPSPANAFTVKKDESSSSSSGGRPVDAGKDEKVSSMKFPGILRTSSSDLNEVSDVPFHHRGHRRAQSEIAFRLPDDIIFDYEPGFLEASAEADEYGDDFLSMLDLDKMNLSSASTPGAAMAKSFNNVNNNLPTGPHHARSYSVDQMLAGFNGNEDVFGYTEEPVTTERPRHRHSHSYSMDGSSTTTFTKEAGSTSGESSKTVSANKLAELALIDPKRAKRILANRQSAARSKERKMRYIAELERKVQALQTEATTLSAQLTIMQNDTTVLTAENNELKYQLQNLEQQTHLSSALNLALKEEVQRLKVATGEVGKNGQIRSRDDHPLLSSKPFYRTQPQMAADSILAGQQLQQLHSALKQQQIAKHQQNIL